MNTLQNIIGKKISYDCGVIMLELDYVKKVYIQKKVKNIIENI